MELLKEEQKYLALVGDKKLKPSHMHDYLNYLYRKATIEKDIDIAHVNWLKVGLASNNKHLIDAAFAGGSFSLLGGFTVNPIARTDKQIEDALQYAITHKNEINPKLVDRLVTHLVNEEFDYKHYVQRPETKISDTPGFELFPFPKQDIEIPARFSHISHNKLNQIDYLIEKVKDTFKKPEEIKSRIAQMREKMNNSPDNQEVVKLKQ